MTWTQREDPHWFGGRIADTPASVEFVVEGANDVATYRRFDGSGLRESYPNRETVTERIAALTHMKPVSLP